MKNPSETSVNDDEAVTVLVVGFVPSVCIDPAGKSGSLKSISEVTLPTGTTALQSPLLSVVTIDTKPKALVTSTSIFGILASPTSCVPLLL